MKTFRKTARFSDVRYEVRGAVAREALRMEENGESIIRLNIGNPACFGFSSPANILENVKSSIPASQAYSGAHGIPEAIEAIAAYDAQKGIENVKPEDVYTGNGVSELIQICMDALLGPGDEVLIPAPDYPLWTAAATFAEAKVVHYVCDEKNNWYPDTEDMERKVTGRTKAIVIINPNNPTGAVYPREVLEKIADVARKHELIIFADEIYDRLVYDGKESVSIASLAPDVFCVTMNGLSKSHMLCGLRVGWMTLSGNKEAARDYIEGIDMLTDMRLCSNVPGQQAIASALSGEQRAEEYFMRGGRAREQLNLVYRRLNEIPGVSAVKPEAAFYIFPRIDAASFNVTDDTKFALDFLREKKVLVVPGSGFNWAEPDHMRWVCLPDEAVLSDAVDRLADFLSYYKQK